MFYKARLKLTIWYLLIITLVCFMFSLIIYNMISTEVDRFARRQRFDVEDNLIIESKQRIAIELLSINGIIILVSGGLSYFLAGKTLKPISEMVDEQNRFIGDASHELRTPLTSLKSSFEVYLRSKDPNLNDAKTLISESITDVDKLQSLSESLLQLAQYQKPNGHSKLEKLTLKPIIDGAIRKLKTKAEENKIQIIKQVSDISIVGNKYALEDLFVILLDNSIKYAKPKTKVIISDKKINEKIEVTVSDSGIGISSKDLPHIFNRFYRADTARASDGYGLGLSIAKKIMDNHHGQILVESQTGKGTTVKLLFSLSS